ncbi:MAG: diaminopimelate decarboxylase [Campylobacterales bacterium]|nr:diaminopimelate decarboxylase [Campylobacterales bacterium]
MNFKELAKKYGTPLYLYDFNHIQDRFLELKEAFKGKKSLVCYAVKANSNLSIIKHLSTLEAGADCVSIGEVKRALLCGIPKYKIIFSGVGKRDDEISEALKEDILMINLESEGELDRVEAIAKQMQTKARISIRVNPNIDPKTHPYISTGLSHNKFGVDIEVAKRMYIRAKNSENLDPIGVHFHIGSQLTELEPIIESSQIVSDLVRSLKALKIDIKFFDIGGGIGIRYSHENTIDVKSYVDGIFSTLKGLDVTVVCEPGRFIVGNSGFFLTKVLYEKTNGDKRFVIVDGAMNDLIRPSLYKAHHDIKLLSDELNHSKADIVGPVCESGDFFAKNIDFPKTTHDDLIVVHSAGAYGSSMASNYNTRGKVAEVGVLNGEDFLIRKRDSFEDMIKNELECLG